MPLILWFVILAIFIYYRIGLVIIALNVSLLLTALIRVYGKFKRTVKYGVTMAIWVIALVLHIAIKAHWLAAVVDVFALILLTVEFLNPRRQGE